MLKTIQLDRSYRKCANCGRLMAPGKVKRVKGFILGPRCYEFALGKDNGVKRRRILRLLALVETQPDV